MAQSGYVNAYLENDRTIRLLGRDENGKRIMRSVPAEYIAYFKFADLDEKLHRDLRSSVYVKGIKREGDWLRVEFANRIARADFCEGRRSFVAQLGLNSYEADVAPINRHVVDHNLTIIKPRRVYLDIETDSRVTFAKKEDMRILSWALVDEDEMAQVGVLEADTERAEKLLLEELWRALEPYDQVVAWNGDNFDFPVLWARSESRGIEVDANRWLWLDHMVLFRRMNLNASESGDEKQSMRLNDIAYAELGEGKEETPPEVEAKFGKRALGALSWQLWEAGGEYRDILVRYNLRDTDLLRKLEKETGYIALFDTVCEVCHIFGDSRALNPTHQMDGFMLRLGLERGHHYATKRYYEGNEKFKGAYVMDPTYRGIARNVHVADFASLYPSIIITWNMSPDTKVSSNWDDGPACQSPLTNICFRTDVRGILPDAVAELIRMRKHCSDMQASFPPGTDEHQEWKRKSNAYKVTANSFYGVVGSPFSRYFDRQVAESVTQNGKWLILKTKEAAEKVGYSVGYADTDSIFVTGCTREEFAKFVEWCNTDLYPEILKEVGCTENKIKLAYEKAFDRVFFTSAKKYAGNFLHYKGKEASKDSKPEIKGLEWKRGDALRMARQFQGETIDMLVGGLRKELTDKFGDMSHLPEVVPTENLDDYHLIIARTRTHVLEAPLGIEEIRQSKALKKPIKEYVQKVKTDGTLGAQPPHVVVAKILKQRGEEVGEGTRIEYIVTDGASSPMQVIPADDYTGQQADRYYLWESLIYPPVQRVLEAAFPDHDWASWLPVRPKKPRAPRSKKTPPQLPQGTA